MNCVISRIQIKGSAGNDEIVFNIFSVARCLKSFAAHGIAVKRLIVISTERFDGKIAAGNFQRIFRRNTVTVCSDIKRTAVDGHRACRNGVIGIGDGFDAIVIGVERKAAAVDRDTAIGGNTVIGSSHIVGTAVEGLCRFFRPFNAVFRIAVDVQRTFAAEGHVRAAFHLDGSTLKIFVGIFGGGVLVVGQSGGSVKMNGNIAALLDNNRSGAGGRK